MKNKIRNPGLRNYAIISPCAYLSLTSVILTFTVSPFFAPLTNITKPSFFAIPSTPKPVKTGDELEVKVEEVASKGDGIAKKDGYVVFVKDAKQGEAVKVKITDVRARFAIGEIIK